MKKFFKPLMITLTAAIMAVAVCAFAACNNGGKADLKLNAYQSTSSASSNIYGNIYTITGEIVSLYENGTYEYTKTSDQYGDWAGGFIIESYEWRTGTYEISVEDEYGMTVVLSVPERVTTLRYVDVMPDASSSRDTADLSTFATEESDGTAERDKFMEAYTALTIEIDLAKHNMFKFVEA